MQSRLADLRAKWTAAGGVTEEESSEAEKDEYSILEEDTQSADVFLDRADQIEEAIGEIRRLLGDMKQEYSMLLSSVTGQEEETHGGALKDLVQDIDAKSRHVRSELKDMAKDNIEYKKLNSGNVGTIEVREKKLTHLTQQFLAVMEQLHAEEGRNRDRVRERVANKVRMVDPTITNEAIEEIMDSGASAQIFAEQMKDEKKHEAAKNALIYINEQHEDLKSIHENMREVLKMFEDMQDLIYKQGEILDDIDQSVDRSKAYVGKGVDDLEEGHKGANKARVKIIIIIALIIIFGVIFCVLICVILCIIIIVVIVVAVVALVASGAIPGIIGAVVGAVEGTN